MPLDSLQVCGETERGTDLVTRLSLALPEALACNRERLHTTGALWVPASADAFYMEWDLSICAPEARDLDLLFRLDRADSALSGAKPLAAPLIARCAQWQRQSQLAARCSPYLWFELDRLREPPRSRPVPGVSVCLQREFARTHQPVAQAVALDRASLVPLFHELCELYETRFVGETVANRIVNCLPLSAQLLHASVMGGRASRRHKLYLTLSQRDVIPMLDRIGWEGCTFTFQRVLGKLSEEFAEVRIDLAFDDWLHPYVGLEFFSVCVPPLDPSRTNLLCQFQEMGLVDAQQVSSLKAWSGCERTILREGQWPTRIDRWFDLKLLQSSDQLRLKAYLGARVGKRLF